VRIDGCDSGRHCDHGLQRVAVIGEHRASRFDRSFVRRSDDAAAMTGGVEVHGRSRYYGRAREPDSKSDNPGKFARPVDMDSGSPARARAAGS
jgi:hypothetical protein